MKRGAGWPIAIAALLGTCVGANLWLLNVASSDPAFAVERDYYQRAVNFERELAGWRDLEESGWRILPAIDSVRSNSSILVSLTLQRRQYPVDGASVQLRAAHVAYARTPIVTAMRPAGEGRYQVWLRGLRRGLWDLTFEVSLDTLRFSTSERFEIGQNWK
jgi:nitrogen fixation protein FixH